MSTLPPPGVTHLSVSLRTVAAKFMSSMPNLANTEFQTRFSQLPKVVVRPRNSLSLFQSFLHQHHILRGWSPSMVVWLTSSLSLLQVCLQHSNLRSCLR